MDLVRHRHGPRVEHLLVELLLLQIGQLVLELVLVDALADAALLERLGNLLADGVLVAEVFPVDEYPYQRIFLRICVCSPEKRGVGESTGCKGRNVHGLVDLVDGQAAVDLLHGRAGVLHRVQRLLVDVGRLDRGYLALDRHHLRARLVQLVLELLLPT